MTTRGGSAVGVATVLTCVAVSGCACSVGRTPDDSGARLDAHGADVVSIDAFDPADGALHDCAFVRTDRPPIPAVPRIGPGRETIDLSRWGIASDGTDAEATTNGLNAALIDASMRGIGEVHVPAGEYLLGVTVEPRLTTGLDIPDAMRVVFDPGAIVRMRPNASRDQCLVRITGHDVWIEGGRFIGDRDAHTFPEGVSLDGGILLDEAHVFCIEESSERIEIARVYVEGAVADGIFVVALDAPGAHASDIWIHDSELARNGRQGISIVGARRVRIEDNFIHDTNGIQPEFGIDVEAPRYSNADIWIHHNRFEANVAGHVANTDGRNVWIEDNDCVQGTLARERGGHRDAPIFFHDHTETTIVDNRIEMSGGTEGGGDFAIRGEIHHADDRPGLAEHGTIIEHNTVVGGGIHSDRFDRTWIERNVVREGAIFSEDVTCHVLIDNDVANAGSFGGRDYALRRARGFDSGNLSDGEDVSLGMSLDTPTSRE
ncbi:MAG: right-handed parallel beta-helix repeat-containing protein [Deltaproteobacteria bacterium]|nr:right-handed parallel beta-helix repeat-containing protein [Deltaproteobacteria bacterium]